MPKGDQWPCANSNLTSISLSRSAGSYFHFLTAWTRAATSTGFPPSSLIPTTRPSVVTVNKTRATPSIFILRASSGYSGGALNLSLRELVCACDDCAHAGAATILHSRIAARETLMVRSRRSMYGDLRVIELSLSYVRRCRICGALVKNIFGLKQHHHSRKLRNPGPTKISVVLTEVNTRAVLL